MEGLANRRNWDSTKENGRIEKWTAGQGKRTQGWKFGMDGDKQEKRERRDRRTEKKKKNGKL